MPESSRRTVLAIIELLTVVVFAGIFLSGGFGG